MDSKDKNAETAANAREKAIAAAEAKAARGELIGKDGRHVNPKSLQGLKKSSATVYTQKTDAEKKEFHRAGQRASVKAQERRRTIKDIYNDLLAISLTAEQTNTADNLLLTAQSVAHSKGKSLTQYDAVALAMLTEAQAGNVKAAAFVRDSVGDKPADVQQIDANILTDGDKALIDKLAKKAGLTNPTDEKQRNNDNK